MLTASSALRKSVLNPKFPAKAKLEKLHSAKCIVNNVLKFVEH